MDDIKYVVSANYQYRDWGQYPAIDLFGINDVPLLESSSLIWQSHVDKLSKLVLDSKDKYTLKTGEKLDLGQGYSLEAKQIDISGKKVWLEFDYNGEYVDDAIISADSGDHTWTCIIDKIQCGNDVSVFNVPVLKVHVNHVFQDAVDSVAQIDGLWLVDYSNTMILNIGDKFGEYTLAKIIGGMHAANLGSLVFEKTLVVPVADFSAYSIRGEGTVKFTDASTGSPTSWHWDFGDGATSCQQNPTHAYPSGGTYTVTLTVKNAAGTNSITKHVYVTLVPKMTAAFSASPISGKAPLTVRFTDESIGFPISWYWNFGDNNTSPAQNPVHTYKEPGNYTVTLSVSNGSRPSNRLKKSNYITVTQVNILN